MKLKLHEEHQCAFCGLEESKVRMLIGGVGGIYICNECIELCIVIIEERYKEDGKET